MTVGAPPSIPRLLIDRLDRDKFVFSTIRASLEAPAVVSFI